MKRYKMVYVSTCRGEVDVMSVSVLVTEKIVTYLCEFILDNMEELGVYGEEGEEFVTLPTHNWKEDIYSIGLGEDNGVIILGERNKYYKEIDNHENRTHEQIVAWENYIHELD